MIDNNIIYAIIPARGGSERLKRKNIYPVWGKPMISWAISAAKCSKYIDKVYISTEDDEIASVAKKCGGEIIKRPAELADNFTFKQDVITHALNEIESKPDIVISLQANSPQIKSVDLDKGIEKLFKFDRSEIFSVDEDLNQNGAFRIMKYAYAFQKSISTYCGVLITNYLDVHTLKDVEFINSLQRENYT